MLSPILSDGAEHGAPQWSGWKTNAGRTAMPLSDDDERAWKVCHDWLATPELALRGAACPLPGVQGADTLSKMLRDVCNYAVDQFHSAGLMPEVKPLTWYGQVYMHPGVREKTWHYMADQLDKAAWVLSVLGALPAEHALKFFEPALRRMTTCSFYEVDRYLARYFAHPEADGQLLRYQFSQLYHAALVDPQCSEFWRLRELEGALETHSPGFLGFSTIREKSGGAQAESKM